MHEDYYRNPQFWNASPEPYMVQVQQDLLDLIPPSVSSALDIGCGNGFITNALPSHMRVVGMDISLEALRHVKRLTCMSDIRRLPFHDAVFDLVMANDVLEHIPDTTYAEAVHELFRVARQSVIITVPFLEDIVAGQIRCKRCGKIFHKNYHQRSFALEQIQVLQTNTWRLGQIILSGTEWDEEPFEIARLRQGLGRFASGAHPLCPACGYVSHDHTTVPLEDPLWAVSASLSAQKIQQYDYVPCRTEAICCFYRTGLTHPWASCLESRFSQSKTASSWTAVDLDPLEIDFRERAAWYRKNFLPIWGTRAYFYADPAVPIDTAGLTLIAGQEVKVGFFAATESSLLVAGHAPTDTQIDLYVYGLTGYQVVYTLHVNGDFYEYIPHGKASFPYNPYGRLFAIRCSQGTAILHRCRYGTETFSQIWYVQEGEGRPSPFLRLPLDEVPLLLSTRYYHYLLPADTAVVTGIRSRTVALQQHAKQTPAWQVLAYLVHSVDEWQKTVRSHVEASSQQVMAIQNKQAAVEVQMAACMTHLDTLQMYYTATQTHVTALEAQLAASTVHIEGTQTHVTALEAQLAASTVHIESTQTRVTALEAQLAASTARLEDAQTRTRRLETQYEVGATQLDFLSRQLHLLRPLIAAMKRLRDVWHRLKARSIRQISPSRDTSQYHSLRQSPIEEQSAPVPRTQWLPRSVVMLVPDDRIDRRVLFEARSLVQAGWNVTVVAAPPPTPDYRLDEDLFPEIEIVRVDASRAVEIAESWRSPFAPPGEERWQEFYWLTNHYYLEAAKRPSQVIVAHDLPVLPAAIMAAVRHQAFLVYDAHELYPEQYHFGQERIAYYRRVETALISFPQQVVTVNRSIAREMVERYHIPEPAVILNCPDYQTMQIGQQGYNLRTNLHIPENKKILLYQGGLSLNRNLEALVAAMAMVPNPHVVLILMGPGDEKRAELTAIATVDGTLGKRVYFHPPVPQHELIPYTRSADAGIVPYPHIDFNSYYCTPNKLFDFLVAGIPILANHSPELKRFSADLGVGMVHNMTDTAQIAEAIEAFFAVDHTSYKQRLLEVGKDFTWEGQAAKFVDIYEQLIKQPLKGY